MDLKINPQKGVFTPTPSHTYIDRRRHYAKNELFFQPLTTVTIVPVCYHAKLTKTNEGNDQMTLTLIFGGHFLAKTFL